MPQGDTHPHARIGLRILQNLLPARCPQRFPHRIVPRRRLIDRRSTGSLMVKRQFSCWCRRERRPRCVRCVIKDNNTLWSIALSSESYDPAESVVRKVVQRSRRVSCRQRLKPGFEPSICGMPEGMPRYESFLISSACSLLSQLSPFECPWA